jgi:hypothetical protein
LAGLTGYFMAGAGLSLIIAGERYLSVAFVSH